MTVSSSTPKRKTAAKRPSETADSNANNKTETDMVNVETVENGQNTDMNQDTKLDVVAKSSKKEADANNAPTQIQVASSMVFMNRPIEHSHLEIAGMLSPNRPIFKSNTDNEVALIHLEDAVGALANRPIEASHLQITSMVMNRPIASNEIDNPLTLMGFLD